MPKPTKPSTTSQPANKKYQSLAMFNMMFTLFVIVWGAFVRASHSGAGCGAHWPLCNGEINPTIQSWEMIIEYTHRLTSGLLLLGIWGMYIFARKIYQKNNLTRYWAGWTAIAITIEALIGAVLVLAKLVEYDASAGRAAIVGLHLVNTFFLMACLSAHFWFAKNPGATRFNLTKNLNTKWVARFRSGVGIIVLVGLTGGIAALGNTLFPVATLAEGLAQDLDPNSNFLLRLRMLHPIFGFSMVLYFYWFTIKISGQEEIAHQHKTAQGLKIMCFAQLLIGFVNLGLKAPVTLQLIHLFMSQIIVVIFTLCWVQIRYKKKTY